jgi:hypothetical protein
MFRLIVIMCLGMLGLYGQNCVPAPILPATAVSGILSNTSCTLSDGTAYTSYRLVLPVRGQAQLTLNPNPAGLNLMLRDGAGVQIASGSSLQQSLEAGAYTIVVNQPALPAAGTIPAVSPFTLQTSFTAEASMLCSGYPLIGLNQTVAGTLGSSGCITPDGTLYEGYTVNTFGAGTLNVAVSSQEFQPLLIVRTSDGIALGSDAASLKVAVDGSSQYRIVVATGDITGAYQLSTTFTPAASETCLPQNPLSPPSTDNNSITSSSCSQIIDNFGDQAFYNYYSFTLPSNGQVDISVSSSDFAPTLYLLDAAGNTVAVDSGGGAVGSDWPSSEIRMPLPGGTYSVQVFSNYTSGGTYQMSYDFTPGPPQACTTAALDPAGSATGTLSAVSCRTQLGLTDIYAVTLPSDGALTLDLNTRNFTGQLALRDRKDNLIVLNQDVEGLGNSHLSATLPAGTYTVTAASVSGAGAYQLVSGFTAAGIASCSYVQQLSLNGGFIQNLSPSSCVGPNGQPMDLYQFTLPGDGTVAAVMTSSQLDSHLALLDSSGVALRSDDNSYGFNDPLIVQFLHAGTYQLLARAQSATVGGLYQVNLLWSQGQRPAFCGSKGTIAPGGSISDALTYTACQFTDATFADVYQMSLAADTTIDLRLNSNDFDAYLVLQDAKGNLMAQDDDGGGGTNARIRQLLPAGKYYVFAKPFANYYSTGKYTLTLAGQ